MGLIMFPCRRAFRYLWSREVTCHILLCGVALSNQLYRVLRFSIAASKWFEKAMHVI